MLIFPWIHGPWPRLPGVKLPNTLIFDYPTVSAISAFAAAQVGATTSAQSSVGLAGAAEHGGAVDVKITSTMKLELILLNMDILFFLFFFIFFSMYWE